MSTEGHWKNCLFYDEFLTLIVEVEAVLNSRPLTYVSSEDIKEHLTPSHLLVGHRILLYQTQAWQCQTPTTLQRDLFNEWINSLWNKDTSGIVGKGSTYLNYVNSTDWHKQWQYIRCEFWRCCDSARWQPPQRTMETRKSHRPHPWSGLVMGDIPVVRYYHDFLTQRLSYRYRKAIDDNRHWRYTVSIVRIVDIVRIARVHAIAQSRSRTWMASDPTVKLVKKKKTKSPVWSYFGLKANESGIVSDADLDRPICRQCYKPVPAKGGNTSNLFWHLRENHAKSYAEVYVGM